MTTNRANFGKLVGIVRRLRSPRGCPWDRRQTLQDIKAYLIDEAYEVLEAVENEDMETLKEELGDLLFQIVFIAQLAEEGKSFDMRDVIEGIYRKMIRRHPHVFGNSKVRDPKEVLAQWDAIKAQEGKPSPTSALSGVSSGLPSLYVAYRLGIKASKAGFDWKGTLELMEKVEEELEEMQCALKAGDSKQAASELGDLLFTLANLARHLGRDPEGLLRRANEKFAQRFLMMEQMAEESGRDFKALSSEEMEELWGMAKGGDKKTDPG